MLFFIKRRKNGGNITVEASLIVPLIILSIAAVIYMGLLLYQRTLLQSAAETAASDGAAAWSSGIGEIGSGRVSAGSFDKSRLYGRIFDSDADMRLDMIEDHAASLFKHRLLVKPAETTVKAELNDFVVCRKLVVTITQSYRFPLGGLLKLFGGSGNIEIHVKCASMLDEPTELIRNTDFIIDLEKKLESSNPNIKNLGEKARGEMNNIKSKLEEFLK